MRGKGSCCWFEVKSFYADRDCPVRNQTDVVVLFATCEEVTAAKWDDSHILQLMEDGRKIRRRDLEKTIQIQKKQDYRRKKRRYNRKVKRREIRYGKIIGVDAWKKWKEEKEEEKRRKKRCSLKQRRYC